MSDVVSVRWSPLCETDSSVAQAYYGAVAASYAANIGSWNEFAMVGNARGFQSAARRYGRGLRLGTGRAVGGDGHPGSAQDDKGASRVDPVETVNAAGDGCDGKVGDGDNGQDRGNDVIAAGPVGKQNARNRAKREKQRRKVAELARMKTEVDSGVDCKSGGSASGGSVHTVDTRTGVEIEASQTLAVRRVAENKLAAKKAEADRLLVEFRIKSLQDKSRTKAVERLAAARMEEKINKAKKNSEAYFKDCDQSLKSLGSTGSAGEFALKTQIKDARDNEAILAYVQEQNRILVHNASPEVLDAVSRVKKPVIEEEFDAFGDCPSDYNEDEAEAYCNDRNRRNDEMARRLQCVDEQPIYGRW